MLIDTALGHRRLLMLKIAMLAAAAALSVVALSSEADAGCYRVGPTGYHWYRYCVGPAFLYPHQRVCHNGRCWYR
jgi:hypothetical protein